VAALNGVRQIDILPYHQAGAGKCGKLNAPDPACGIPVPSIAQVQAAITILERFGLRVNVGG